MSVLNFRTIGKCQYCISFLRYFDTVRCVQNELSKKFGKMPGSTYYSFQEEKDWDFRKYDFPSFLFKNKKFHHNVIFFNKNIQICDRSFFNSINFRVTKTFRTCNTYTCTFWWSRLTCLFSKVPCMILHLFLKICTCQLRNTNVTLVRNRPPFQVTSDP